MDAMPRPRPPYIQRHVTRHGRVIWYFRRDNGAKVRLPDQYGTKEFWAAYNAALAGKDEKPTRADPRTLAWLVEQYKRSGAWQRLAPSTKRVRDRLMQTICQTAGRAPIEQITRQDIQAGADKRAAKPEAANAFVKTMRVLLRHAVSMDVVQTNVADAVPLMAGSAEGVHTWSMEEIAAFEEAHPVGTKARLALDLMLYAGLRKSDVVQVGRQHLRDGTLTIRPEKTKRTSNVTVTIPVLRPLAESIAAAPTGDLHLLVTEFGKPFTANGFGNWFKKRCLEAGLPQCSAHGLRKASATRAAENGATTHELMAIYGWVTIKEAERYTRAADRRRLGMAGREKLAPTLQQGGSAKLKK